MFLNGHAIADELRNSIQFDYCTECLATRYLDLFLCGLSQREIPHIVIVSDVDGGRYGWICHESETSQMGMRNANYLLTQYTLLEWFSGFDHSILKVVFLDKYRR